MRLKYIVKARSVIKKIKRSSIVLGQRYFILQFLLLFDHLLLTDKYEFYTDNLKT